MELHSYSLQVIAARDEARFYFWPQLHIEHDMENILFEISFKLFKLA
jgi:hypothetical protein